jgi:hypothetical protein
LRIKEQETRLILPEHDDDDEKINVMRQKGKGKGKAIPLKNWTVPEGSRRLRLPDFKTVYT